MYVKNTDVLRASSSYVSICERAGASPTPEHAAKHTAVLNSKAGRLLFLWVSSMHASKSILRVEHEAYGRLV